MEPLCKRKCKTGKSTLRSCWSEGSTGPGPQTPGPTKGVPRTQAPGLLMRSRVPEAEPSEEPCSPDDTGVPGSAMTLPWGHAPL